METVGRLLLVQGRVQGVAFRASCAREAQRWGVSGYARNLPSGDVEVLLEGPLEAVEKVLLWCHQGPPAARVDAVSSHAVPPSQIRHFDVR